MPFAELIRTMGERPSPNYNPIYQVRFALQNHPVPDVELRGLSLKLEMRSTGTPRFDVGCEVTEKGDILEVVWLFRESLFLNLKSKNWDASTPRCWKASAACRKANCCPNELIW